MSTPTKETPEQTALRAKLDENVRREEARMNHYLSLCGPDDNGWNFHKAVDASIDLDIERAFRDAFLRMAGLEP